MFVRGSNHQPLWPCRWFWLVAKVELESFSATTSHHMSYIPPNSTSECRCWFMMNYDKDYLHLPTYILVWLSLVFLAVKPGSFPLENFLQGQRPRNTSWSDWEWMASAKGSSSLGGGEKCCALVMKQAYLKFWVLASHEKFQWKKLRYLVLKRYALLTLVFYCAFIDVP